MDKKKLLFYIVFLMFFMFLMDFLAKSFFWYFTLWYFDIFMHFLGGLWVGLFFIYVFSRKNASFDSIKKIILYVLLIGVLWEFFEIFANQYIGRNPFDIWDTLADLFFDLLGAFVATFYFSKKIVSKVMKSDSNEL